jgi:hypothetical protein
MSKRKKKKAGKSKDGTTSAAKDAPTTASSKLAKAPPANVPLALNEGGETAPEPFSSDD